MAKWSWEAAISGQRSVGSVYRPKLWSCGREKSFHFEANDFAGKRNRDEKTGLHGYIVSKLHQEGATRYSVFGVLRLF